MKKYFEVAKLLFKAQLSWRFDIAFNMLFTVIKIIFANIVWGAVFGENNTVEGFTFNIMLTYYVISSFLSGLDLSDGVSREISARIRDGSFSKFMIIPIKVEGYFHAQNYGAAAMYMIFNFMAAIIWVFLFKIEFTITTDFSILLQAILMTLMGLYFMVQLNFFIGIQAFKYQDIGFFIYVKGNIVAFVTGSLIPLALLSEGIISVMRILPFYYVIYLPSMLFIGFNTEEIQHGIITLACWIIAFIFIDNVSFDRLRKKYDGVGI